jgi:predicted nucleic acid-binding protein
VIVLDASVMVDLLIKDDPQTAHIRTRLAGELDVHAPHLVDAEVTHALRGLVLRDRLAAARARRAIRRFAVLPLTRWPQTPLLSRVFALRDQLTAYDATYVALAEGLGATLLTRDARMAKAGGHRARIEVV